MSTPPTPLPPEDSILHVKVEALKVLNQYIQSDTSVINAKLTQYIAVQSLLVVAISKQ